MQSFNQKQQPLFVLNTVKALILFLFFLCSFLLSCGDNSSKGKGKEAETKECKCIAGEEGLPILLPKEEETTIEELQKACSKLKGYLQDCS